ncbi:unnamed protein product, partial [Tetraodon nigroviridis]
TRRIDEIRAPTFKPVTRVSAADLLPRDRLVLRSASHARFALFENLRPKPMGSHAGWRLQKQSEPSDSAKLGACEMTLCSHLKGQHCSAGKRLKNAL